MSRNTIQKAITKVIQPAIYEYVCDGCGHVFKKGERKVTYYSHVGKQHACYDKPCSPFSRPKGYESVWDSIEGNYVWRKLEQSS